MVADLRKTQENQRVSEIRIDKYRFVEAFSPRHGAIITHLFYQTVSLRVFFISFFTELKKVGSTLYTFRGFSGIFFTRSLCIDLKTRVPLTYIVEAPTK